MCLYIKVGEKRKCTHTAKQNITCYKIMVVCNDGTLMSPYQAKKYEIGTVYTEPEYENCYTVADYHIYAQGYLYGYLDKDDAEEMYTEKTCSLILRNFVSEYYIKKEDIAYIAICKCTIPEGTIYIVSQTDSEVATKRMRIDKIINKKKL